MLRQFLVVRQFDSYVPTLPLALIPSLGAPEHLFDGWSDAYLPTSLPSVVATLIFANRVCKRVVSLH